MKILISVMLSGLLSPAFASAQVPLQQMEFDGFTAYTTDESIVATLKSDACARAALVSVKTAVLDKQAMEEGVDLPESVDVSFLAVVSTNALTANQTYSVSLGDGNSKADRLVPTRRSAKGRRCTAGQPYTAAL